jgi:hypothetical protein
VADDQHGVIDANRRGVVYGSYVDGLLMMKAGADKYCCATNQFLQLRCAYGWQRSCSGRAGDVGGAGLRATSALAASLERELGQKSDHDSRAY